MENNLSISHYCRITNRQVMVDGRVVFEDNLAVDLKDFLKSLYQFLDIEYGKYFKMDTLCKLAFASAELLLKHNDFLAKYPKDSIGIILSNSSSSLDTDRKHQATIVDADNYFPSPSLFVYTLPSIMNGEMAIRHGIQGENNFFLADNFSPILLIEMVSSLFEGNYIKACITGWVDVVDGKEEVLLVLIEKGNQTPFTSDMLSQLLPRK